MKKGTSNRIREGLNIIIAILFIMSLTIIMANSANNNVKEKSNNKLNYVYNSNINPTRSIVYSFWEGRINPSSYQPKWDSLTHVAYFYWDVKPDGTLVNPNITRFNIVKTEAKQHGVKIIICVATDNQDIMDSILANNKDIFANNVLNAVQKNGADGVNLDFEFPRMKNGITQTSNAILFEKMMATLYTKLKTVSPAYHISIDVPGWNSPYVSLYYNENLNKYLDCVFLMSYDYHSSSSITGSISPYSGLNEYGIVNSVNSLLKYYDKQKIILGLPLYGRDWTATSDKPGSKTTSCNVVKMDEAISNSQKYGRIWDLDSSTPWYRYQRGNEWHQVWYEDDKSIGLKYNYSKTENLAGVGFWALGMEGNYTKIWGVLTPPNILD